MGLARYVPYVVADFQKDFARKSYAYLTLVSYASLLVDNFL